METAISVSGLKKNYKTYSREQGILASIKSLFHRDFQIKHALKGINFEVEKGEILGFIGPNGAGKSTAIKVLCGILHPTDGKVDSFGFNPWEQRIEYAKHFGVVFGQKSQLEWDLPPNDTFHLIKVLYDIPESAFKRRLNQMVKLLKVEQVYKTPVRDLSLGERMKCEVIAALLHKPKLVLLDEPTIGMDVVAKKRLHGFIKKINQENGTTFLITTHDMNDIEKLCNCFASFVNYATGLNGEPMPRPSRIGTYVIHEVTHCLYYFRRLRTRGRRIIQIDHFCSLHAQRALSDFLLSRKL